MVNKRTTQEILTYIQFLQVYIYYNLQYMTIIYPPAGKLKLKIKECRLEREGRKTKVALLKSTVFL